MNKAFFIISILVSYYIIGSKEIYSQGKEKSFEISLGIEFLKIKDNNFSPMMYKGLPYIIETGFLTETSNYKDDLTIQFLKGNLRSGTDNVFNRSEAKLIGGNINWVHLRKLNILLTTKNSFYLGGVFNSSFTFYKRNYYGEDSYYLYQSSLGPSFHITHPFEFKSKSIFFISQLNIAILSYAVYPSYSSPMPDRLLNKDLNDISIMDYITGGKILAINNFQRVNYIASFVYALNTKFVLKLNYNWELINVVRQNSLTKVNHDFFLSLIIK